MLAELVRHYALANVTSERLQNLLKGDCYDAGWYAWLEKLERRFPHLVNDFHSGTEINATRHMIATLESEIEYRNGGELLPSGD